MIINRSKLTNNYPIIVVFFPDKNSNTLANTCNTTQKSVCTLQKNVGLTNLLPEKCHQRVFGQGNRQKQCIFVLFRSSLNLSCHIVSCHVLSRLVLCYVVLSWLVLPGLVWSCLVLSGPVSCYVVKSGAVWSCLVLSGRVLSCRIMRCCSLPLRYLVLSSLVLC